MWLWLTCSRYEVTEWNQTTEARDDGDGCLEETFAKTDRCGRVRGGHIHYFLKNVDHHVNQLDPSKGNNDAAEAAYQQIVLKKTSG